MRQIQRGGTETKLRPLHQQTINQIKEYMCSLNLASMVTMNGDRKWVVQAELWRLRKKGISKGEVGKGVIFG